jgi:hypothetical protein
MQINPGTGFFDIQPGETITIKVTASNTEYMASFPPSPSCTAWSNIQGPAGGIESRQFVAPATGDCFVVITFDFQSNHAGAFDTGAKYDINVTGSAGGAFDDAPVVPPPVKTRQYKFHVV